MFHESRRYLVAGAISMLLILATAVFANDGDSGRAHPDRDDTRVEHIVDLQLPTL